MKELLCTLLIVALGIPALAGSPVQPAYGYERYVRIRYRLAYDETSRSASPGGVMVTRLEAETSHRAESVRDGMAAVDGSIEKIKVRATLDKNDLSPQDPGRLRKVKLRFRVGPTGITDPPDWHPKGALDAGAWSGLQATADRLRAASSLCFPVLPGRAVDIGDRWDSRGPLPAGLPGVPVTRLEGQSTFTLTGLEKIRGKLHATIEERLEVAHTGPFRWIDGTVQSSLGADGTIHHTFSIDEGVPVACEASLKIVTHTEALRVDILAPVHIEIEGNWAIRRR